MPGAGAQIGRRLDVGAGPQRDPRGGDGPEKVAEIRLRRAGHARAGLGAEILDDNSLDMPAFPVRAAQRQQGVDALGAGLADADQEPGGEGNPRFPRRGDGGEAHRGALVGRAVMRSAPFAKPIGGAFQHQPLAYRNLAQRRDLVGVHNAGIDVRQQRCFAENQRARFGEPGQGGVVSKRLERAPRRRVARLRPVAQGEQRLAAAGAFSRPGDRQHLVRVQIGRPGPRRFREGAVTANIAAQFRQRDEDLA